MEQSTTSNSVTHDVDSLASRLLKLCLAINIVLPAVVFLVVYVLKSAGVLPSTSLVTPDILQILFYALLFVAALEVAVAFIIKRAIFAPDKVRPALASKEAFARLATGGSITLAALGGAAMMYGIILYILGLDMARVAIFALLTFVHFRLFRPTTEFLRSLIAQTS
jgi:hypothetical protein